MSAKTKTKKTNRKTKVIFITGGVISGIGKGIASASIGNILKARGYSVFLQKLDPYLNIDPGVLSPYEHGEVYVTEDGGETDLDLGHYERFLNQNLTKDSNYTSGKISQRVFENERKGKYNGKTVQIIPNFTNEIIKIITDTIDKHKMDFHIVEIGGTVGDVESNAFIIAANQYGFMNPQDTFYVHATYVPWLNTSKEFKTKPTQQSLGLLSSRGIKVNMILLRSQNPINNDIKNKIADFAFLNRENVISLHDVDNIYKIPLYLQSQSVAKIILNHFDMPENKINIKEWKDFVEKFDAPNKKRIEIAMVGKYIELEDAYKSIKESLIISACYENVEIDFNWISSETINEDNVAAKLKNANGVVILPGFGKRGFDGKLITANYTREHKIPTLGICFGMQAMTINQARLKGITDATSSEVSDKGSFVLDIIEGKNKEFIGGTLRLGSDKIKIKPNTIAAQIYGELLIEERSRHRYEVNPKFVSQIEDKDFIFSGYQPDSKLIEICELKSHPFYVGVQYHPEFNAKPLKPHKLFTEFIKKSSI